MTTEPKTPRRTCNKPIDPAAFAIAGPRFDRDIDAVLRNCLREFSAHGQMTDTMRAKELLAEVADLLKRKHRNYGEDNLSRFGMFGIIVRLADKYSRLQSLLKVKDEVGESILDTWLDIIGYCAQAIRLYGDRLPRRRLTGTADENLLDAWNKLELLAIETYVAYGVFSPTQQVAMRNFYDLSTHALDALIFAEESEWPL